MKYLSLEGLSSKLLWFRGFVVQCASIFFVCLQFLYLILLYKVYFISVYCITLSACLLHKSVLSSVALPELSSIFSAFFLEI